MEIGHEHVHYAEAETGHDDDAGVKPEFVKAVGIKVSDDGVERFPERIRILPGVWTPLADRSGLPGLNTAHSDVVKRLQSAHRSGTNRYNIFVTILNIFVSLADTLDKGLFNNKRLTMHGVISHIRTFDRQEGARTDVKAYRFGGNTLFPDTFKNRSGKVKAGSGSRHGPAETGVQCLIPFQVHGLCLAVEIWRNGHGSAGLEDCGEGRAVRPGEFDDTCLPLTGEQARLKVHADKP